MRPFVHVRILPHVTSHGVQASVGGVGDPVFIGTMLDVGYVRTCMCTCTCIQVCVHVHICSCICACKYM